MILRRAALLPGFAVLALCAGTVLVLLMTADGSDGLSRADWATLRFTIWQAILSALFSGIVGVTFARALYRTAFPGRGFLITVLGAPFLLPAIVAVLGLLAIWGRGGVVSAGLAPFGYGPIDIYGAHGVIVAHVFFNAPLVARLVLQGWARIPGEQFRLADHLGLTGWYRFRHLEWPMLRTVLPGALLIVFLLCITTFAIALTLGGGPRATTLEVAIYQAIRLEFDLGRAGFLAAIQTGLCLVIAVAVLGLAAPSDTMRGIALRPTSTIRAKGAARFDKGLIALLTLFLASPLVAVLIRGIGGLAELPAGLWETSVRSIILALSSAILVSLLAVPIAWGLAGLRRFAAVAEGAMMVTLAISPFVLAAGLFLMIRDHVSPFAVALPMVVLVNALAALPFALRALVSAFVNAERVEGRLAQSLGLRGWGLWRIVFWPHVRPALGLSAGLAAAVSMGDLGVIALFGSTATQTLPFAMLSLMGAYQMEAAAGVALLLVSLSFALFALFDRWGRA
ncbi:ABC transporter permease subunit [Pontivivens insulae]|uniref:Sulfate transport system permease protein CysW n=1 Tax=Pontivivens insulae TaxID=1639689 RepID=A0A2R8ADN0_9RHOB|nr:ABC transporter permease subunit [Pontivivens insulae]RED14114.1 thiamine transport system permease protein [Pontivivens insulae]SPF30188.1 Sulfate transport system permease protein CysW [Pontivivens insulae]